VTRKCGRTSSKKGNAVAEKEINGEKPSKYCWLGKLKKNGENNLFRTGRRFLRDGFLGVVSRFYGSTTDNKNRFFSVFAFSVRQKLMKKAKIHFFFSHCVAQNERYSYECIAYI
jgi:hypothetical protein